MDVVKHETLHAGNCFARCRVGGCTFNARREKNLDFSLI